MKKTPRPTAGRASRKQTTQPEKDRRDRDRDRDAMSSSMRQLIMSFGEADSERTWDPTVYSRRVDPAR
jgi:hypothetical protein